MAINTAGDMVAAALRTSQIVGTGQTPRAEEFETALDLLNEVVYGWARDHLLSWRLKEITFTSTGAQSYPITDRPVRIASAFARLLTTTAGINSSGLVDFPLLIVNSREAYNEISLKSLTTFPSAVYYDPIWPSPGTLYVWPIPSAGWFEIHISYPTPIVGYAALTDPLGLPPEHLEPLRYCLAYKLAIDYGLQPGPVMLARLKGVMARLRASNYQPTEMKMPAALLPGGAVSGGGISGLVGPFQSVIVLNQSALG